MFDALLVLADDEIIIPSLRAILEYVELHHVNTLNLQRPLSEDIKEASDGLDNALRKHKQGLDNALRKHKQSYDCKFQRLINRRRTTLSKNNSTPNSSNA